MAVLTLVLAAASIYQGWLISRQIKLGRDEFNAAHRPKLLVREVLLHPLEVDGKDQIDFCVANVGESAAIIVDSEMEIVRYDANGELPPMIRGSGEIGRATILTGKRAPLIFQFSGMSDIFDITTQFPSTRGPELVFRGYIAYADRNTGIVRRTAFCRQWSGRGSRFTILEDPDYEYAD